MKKLLIYSFVLLLAACSGKKSDLPASDNIITKYTFSLPHTIDFSVCGASYVVIYNNSHPLDTALLYSGVFNIGKDTLIYAQVRSEPDENGKRFESKNESMHGVVTTLSLYDGKQFHYLKLPYFDPFFSSFCVNNYAIFYWGFHTDKMFACLYNIKTGTTRAVYLSQIEGTDDIGAYNPPHIENSGIVFRDSMDNEWVFNQDLKRVISLKLHPEIKQEQNSNSTNIASQDTKI
ncbi:hypothetical protein [Paludibacter sp.]|uniref:hypothetical protein n=1 Tax=Paludibacter sp. TaxID=1898105 RepID=UPI0013544F17|nr:hypothetical protein [Paludibacter sp.]MTK52529.1 hypothetical protein [Paludibacter sp.]